MKSNTTSNIIAIIAIILSIIAILLSITSLSNKSLQVDWASVLVGILGALATILIGWQIFNVIGFESRIDNMKEELEAKVNDEISKVRDESEFYAKKLSAYSAGLDCYGSDKKLISILYMFTSIALINLYDRVDFTKHDFNIELDYILKVIEEEGNDNDFKEQLREGIGGNKSRYLDALYKLKCNKGTKIIAFLDAL